MLWQTLTDPTPSQPLDQIRARWRQASEKDVPALMAEITAWQKMLWKFVPIGSYRYGNTVRQVACDPPVIVALTGEAYDQLLRGARRLPPLLPLVPLLPAGRPDRRGGDA